MKLITFLLIFSMSAFSYVDLSLQYSLSKRKSLTSDASPSSGEVNSSSGTISVNWAWYIWSYTALELNYSRIDDELVDSRRIQIDTNLFITNSKTQTVTEVKGVGLRFSFAKQNAKFIPSLSFGYAELSTTGQVKYEVENGGVEVDTKPVDLDDEKSGSSYITAGLRIKFTRLMGMNLSAKTVMRDFEFSEASNNVTYSIGLSWIF